MKFQTIEMLSARPSDLD